MLAALVAGIGLLLLLGLAARRFSKAEPRQLLLAGRWLAAFLLLAVALGLIVTGRGSFVFGFLILLAPYLRGLWRRWRATGGAAGTATRTRDQRSSLETRTLRMQLDHASGDLDGEVLAGPYQQRRLSSLTLPELLDLMNACIASDSRSQPLLEAFADRRFPGWRTSAADGSGAEQATSTAAKGPMSRDDAYRILGLSPGADEAAIQEAHHRLIKAVHPDRGGSGFLAAQVNRARDVLLGGPKGA